MSGLIKEWLGSNKTNQREEQKKKKIMGGSLKYVPEVFPNNFLGVKLLQNLSD